ncbi:transcription termination factor Rho [Ruminococcaceae bacterium YRB3002]|nr:transcription termination factor Rho [Ruminococcaceae bacterium YRB3002]
MTELDTLNSKSVADLEEIAVTIGLVAAEQKGKYSKEQLVALISGEPLPAAPAPEVPATLAALVDTIDAAPEEKKAAPKRGRKAKTEETPAEEGEAKPKSSRGRKSKKTEEPAEEKHESAPAQETQPAADAIAESETPKQEEKKSSSKRGRKSKKDKQEDQISITDIIPDDNKAVEPKAEEAKPQEPKAEETKAEEPKQAQPNKDKKGGKSKKRRVSFGPDKNIEEVKIPEGEENADEQSADTEPAQPEITYREVEGILFIGNSDKGDFSGFVHCNNYLPGEDDAYVPGQMIRRMGLRRGDKIKGLVTAPKGKDRYAPLKKVLEVNGIDVSETEDYDVLRKRPRFEHLTAIYPNERLTLETKQEDLSTRIIDLFSPIGKGQRGMIVSPPKAGKTILLQKVANSITANNPSCKLIVLLIDERPEEVTDMQRSIQGEVVYSTFDKRPENHVRVTELVLERAMRLVELGEDVVILLDSMTRLARAYNLTITPTGRTLSGGLDPGSLYGPKRFFGAARNIEFGGSLTIISTALIETGSRMDEVIFEEFKGTGNMEVTLDRKLADRRVFPAIAVDKSGTRREDLLLTQEELEAVWLTRKAIADSDTVAATQAVLDFMKKTTSNASFILSVKKSFDVN